MPEWFYWGTVLAGIPRLILLHRFSPLGERDPVFTIEPPRARGVLSAGASDPLGAKTGTRASA